MHCFYISWRQAEDADGDLEDEDDEEMLLPPRRRQHDHEAEDDDDERGRSSHPAQSSVLYQDLLMSDVEDDASDEEGDNPFSGEDKTQNHFTSLQLVNGQTQMLRHNQRTTSSRSSISVLASEALKVLFKQLALRTVSRLSNWTKLTRKQLWKRPSSACSSWRRLNASTDPLQSTLLQTFNVERHQR